MAWIAALYLPFVLHSLQLDGTLKLQEGHVWCNQVFFCQFSVWGAYIPCKQMVQRSLQISRTTES